MKKWSADDIQDQHGRRFVVTGANTGIGYDTALELARKGGDVILACRSQERGEAAATAIKAKDVTGAAHFSLLDLSDFASIKKFAKNLGKVDVLVNNAGVMVPPPAKTAQGFELQWGVNVTGHALLTALLLPGISDRIVTVSSVAHRGGAIDFENLRGEKPYKAWREYSQSKLGDLLFAIELNERLQANGSKVQSVAAHPGLTATDLQRHMKGRKAFHAIAQSSAAGALPTLYAATENVAGGSYWGPRGIGEARGPPGPAKITASAKVAGLSAKLWEELEKEIGQKII